MNTKKVWLVTGASKGLGLALVKALLNKGYRVAGTSRTLASLTNAVSTSENFLPLQMDLLDETSVGSGVAATIQAFGRVDVIVNNAGYGQLGTLEELSDAEARQNFDTNVFGALNVIRAAMPQLRKQQSGYIMNVSSIGGLTGNFPGWGIYCATKFAMAGFTESLSAEAAEFGVFATVIYPGYFRTNFLESGSLTLPQQPIAAYATARASEQQHKEHITGNQPGDPDKAAQVFIELAEMQHPPLHFVMGSDATAMAQQKIEALQAELKAYEALSVSTDF